LPVERPDLSAEDFDASAFAFVAVAALDEVFEVDGGWVMVTAVGTEYEVVDSFIIEVVEDVVVVWFKVTLV